MRFETIEAIGVGPLLEQELELTPGLNVVHGLNEAGKSSWHAALIAGWLGLRRAKGAPRAADRAFLERFAPWSGAPLIAAVRVVTDDGVRYRLRHNLSDLADHEVADGTNAVVTGEFEQDGTADGAVLLGLTRDLARSTLCVSQADILGVVDAAEGLQTQLQRAAASANRAGGTAAAALRRLDDFRREHVGADRANSTRPLRRAIEARDEAGRALAAAEAEHEQHERLLARRDDARDRHARLSARRDALAARIRAAQLAAERQRLAELEALQHRVEQAADLPAPASDDACDQVDRARQRFAERPGPIVEDDTVERLQAELAALPPSPEGDVEPAPAVVEAHDALRVRRDRLDYHLRRRPDPPPAPELGGLTPDDLDRHAATLEAPPPAPVDAAVTPPAGDRRAPVAAVGLLALAGVQALGGLALVATGTVAAGLAALVAAAVVGAAGWWVARRAAEADIAEEQRRRAREAARQAEHHQRQARRGQALEALEAADVAADDPTELRSLADRARAAQRGVRELADWEADVDRYREAVASETRRLASALADRGVGVDHGDVDAAVERYRDACRRRLDQAARAARRADLERQLQAAQELAEDRRQRTRRRGEAERHLLELARALGFDGGEAEAADGFLVRWRREQRELAERHRQVERARTQLEARLDGATLSSVARAVDAAAAEVGEAEPVDDVAAARRRLAGLDAELEQARDEEAHLEGEVVNAESRMTPVAEVRERLERAEAELARVERLRDVLDATTAHLTDASRRVNQDIAPVLRSALAEHLPAITRERYEDVQVDPRALQVTVRTDGGAYRPAQHLSHGTTEQVYLLLRIGLARHLVVTDETAPLLLDDVTVQFDEHRTVAFLELCRCLAAERQIVLFTQEREVLEWAAATLDGTVHRLHRLPDPVAGG